MALTNPPKYPKAAKSFLAVTTGAKTNDTNTTGAVALFTVPNDNSVAFYRLKRLTVKPLAQVTTATRQKVYMAKQATSTVLGLLRDLLQATMASFSENIATDEKSFAFGSSDYIDFEPGDICYVASGVALAGGFQWAGQVEVY
jgi:hypothetical protein